MVQVKTTSYWLKRIFWSFSIALFLSMMGCASWKSGKNPDSVEGAEKLIVKQRKKDAKAARKEQKAAIKRHWDNQSKEVKRSIKRNKKANKKRTRKMNRR
jgi:hypothetical protein